MENPFYIKLKNDLDSVGRGMCLAKWAQVTLELQTGNNHSCHHPPAHKISIEEIKRNPSALHNTKQKKYARKEMLEGKRPSECEYCWNVENTSDKFSDRIFKSSEEWSYPFMDEIIKSDWRENYNPKYVEVSLSSVCNFKCSYCSPGYSTKWMEEIKKHGGYPTTSNFNSLENLVYNNNIPIPLNDYNPYVESFWKWWPELYQSLKIFRITGGEPLLSKDTWSIFDYILEEKEPNRELKLGINSNLGVSDVLIDKLISKIKKIQDENRVSEVIVFTSVDTWGNHAEYIRHGLEFNRFWDNINKILSQCPKVKMTFMSTYNALSLFKYDKLIYEIYNLKQSYCSNIDNDSSVILDTSYLRYPSHQTVKVLPTEFSKYIDNQSRLMRYYTKPTANNNEIGYYDVEIQKVIRIADWMISPQDENLKLITQSDFYKFFSEHDKRRGTDFCKTFPELEEFYNHCKTIKI
jgi:organic radical activating enzyme